MQAPIATQRLQGSLEPLRRYQALSVPSDFFDAAILIAGIEVMHMIRKGQLGNIKDRASSVANQFYSLAF